MPEPFAPPDTCSYQLQDARTRRSLRRHQLLAALWLSCSAFTWPGRVPQLSYSAAHGNVAERVEALRLLEEYPSQAATDACLAALEDSASEVRTQAARCVSASADDRGMTNLLDLASAKDPQERMAALEALGRFAPARALSTLEQALADQHPGVRLTAARALSAYVREGSVESSKLAPLLHSPDLETRLAAVALLEEQATATGLRASLQPGAAHSESATPVEGSLIAARSSGPDAHAAVPSNTSARPKTPPQPADAASLALLREAVRDSDAQVRASAVRALGRAKLASVLQMLQSATSDPEEAVRLSALAALGDSDLPMAVNPLRASLAKDIRAARTALAALGRIDDPSALTAIASALTRPELAPSAVSALIARARRLPDVATLRATAQALQHAIDVAPGNNSAIDALARGVAELAKYCDMQPSIATLTQALQAGLGEVDSLTQLLLELRAPQLLAALMQRRTHTDPAELPQLSTASVAVIIASDDPASLIAAHHEKLVALVQEPTASSEATIQLRALLDLPRADTDAGQRRALAELWAKLPTATRDRERTDQLLRWLDDADPHVRERSSVALAHHTDNAVLTALAERLERKAPHAELSLQACAGAMLRASQTPERIPSALRERLLQQFQTYLTQPDETIATSALYALRASRDPRAARWIAALLRGSSASLRAAAVQALGDFDQGEARRVLRDMLRGDNLQNASNAAIALAEIGSERDAPALLRAAERGSWPLPPSAAYAIARITLRGATRKHSLERVLCRFTQLRDSYVLANSVAALAALGAEACDAQIDPRALLQPTLPSALRVAAATWLYNIRPRTPEETAEHNTLLAACASDHDDAVAAACAPHPQAQSVSGQTLLRLSHGDGQTALQHRIVALRLPDATVFIGQSDAAGQLLLPRAESGSLSLEDPADQGLVALPNP